jgi:hypothetical protein
LFKINAFPFKKKDKSQIFHAKATFTLCSAAPCLFCFEAMFTSLNYIAYFIITMFFHQSDQFVTDFCTVVTDFCTVVTDFCTAVWD